MKRWLYKILMLVAVATIMGHNLLPHGHHEEIKSDATHHHQNHHDEAGGNQHSHEDNQEEDHNIFSFAQLDTDFIPSKIQLKGIELPFIYLLTPVIAYYLDLFPTKTKNHFGYYREFPPPESYLSNLPSRAPPSL
jgi:hypothetical protein